MATLLLSHAQIGARHQLLRISLEFCESVLSSLDCGPESCVHSLHGLAEVCARTRQMPTKLGRGCLAVPSDSAKGVTDHLRLTLKGVQAAGVAVGSLHQLGEEAVQVFGAHRDTRSWNSNGAQALDCRRPLC